MYFTVEEENLICLYHNADRRRTAANLRAALPDMRLSRIRLFIWLIFCQISVYSTLFSSKKLFSCFSNL